MKRLDGNSVLIIEGDSVYNHKLKEVFSLSGAQTFSAFNLEEAIKSLEIYDFDIVICSYYLSDGLIHNVIDWSKQHLQSLPVFVAIGSSMPGDEELLHRHLISYVFNKGHNPVSLVSAVQGFLFDFNRFFESLLFMVEPKGICLELVVKQSIFEVNAIELTNDGIFVSMESPFDLGTFALLRISIYEGSQVENYTLVGSLGGNIPGGQHFNVNESYSHTWNNVLAIIDKKQLTITKFMKKVSGI
ncbi:MAG TPA: hypothetical protein VNJ08_02575 [Bacteriovoracaceae bacterium]|nr:hypothetical protein [Bacteriovoracaceae bacterium]